MLIISHLKQGTIYKNYYHCSADIPQLLIIDLKTLVSQGNRFSSAMFYSKDILHKVCEYDKGISDKQL